MARFAESLLEFLLRKHIRIRIDAFGIEQIYIQKMISHLVARIAEHNHYFLTASGYSPQTYGESVSAEYRENDSHSTAAQLVLYILCKLLLGSVVGLSAG